MCVCNNQTRADLLDGIASVGRPYVEGVGAVGTSFGWSDPTFCSCRDMRRNGWRYIHGNNVGEEKERQKKEVAYGPQSLLGLLFGLLFLPRYLLRPRAAAWIRWERRLFL